MDIYERLREIFELAPTAPKAKSINEILKTLFHAAGSSRGRADEF